MQLREEADTDGTPETTGGEARPDTGSPKDKDGNQEVTVLLAFLFTYRLTRLAVEDTITEPLRHRILSRWPSDDTVFTDEWITETSGEPVTTGGAEVTWMEGAGWIPTRPRMIGELVTCAWCASLWIGGLVTVGLYALDALNLPWYGWVMLPFGLSAITGLLSGWE